MLNSIYLVCSTKIAPLALSLVGFSLLITVHEFGHYIFAKLFNIHTPIFSIGFGPAIIKKKLGTTEFRIAPIPLGGFCMIDGGSEAELDLPGEGITRPAGEDTFDQKSYWQKFFVMFGGIFFNILFAYAAFSSLYIGKVQKTTTNPTVSSVAKESAAEKYGIKEGDIIKQFSVSKAQDNLKSLLNNQNSLEFSSSETATHDFGLFLRAIRLMPEQEINLTIKRGEELIEKSITIARAPDGETGSLGIHIDLITVNKEGEFETNSLTQGIKKGISLTHQWISHTAYSLRKMFAQKSIEGMGGPIAVISQSYKGAQSGLSHFIAMLASISIGLAIMNLIPFGPLDGSQILLVTIEAIIRRPLHRKIKEGIALAGWLGLLLLIVVLSYRDILRLIGW